MKPFLSICIPSYNRPNEIIRVLNSIKTKYDDLIEIVISENHSMKRLETRNNVLQFKKHSQLNIKYYENEENLGYDHNLRKCASLANGVWIMFVSDDDILIESNLDLFIEFLIHNDNLGYILRRYRVQYNDYIEEFRYSNKNEYFEPGTQSIIELFRRSVFLSGFTFRKECFNDYDCNKFDGTLLFQLYILSTICLYYPSAYCDIPISSSFEGGIPYFGESNSENKLYETGTNSFSNSINFLKQIKIVCEQIDEILKINITDNIVKTYSKYSYGYLHEHRQDGVREFRKYGKEIRKIGLGNSKYFFIYYYSLLILGKKNTRKIIYFIKKIYGRTPKL